MMCFPSQLKWKNLVAMIRSLIVKPIFFFMMYISRKDLKFPFKLKVDMTSIGNCTKLKDDH